MADATSFPDGQALRRALGRFATGVAIVTAVTAEGERVGATINSFASVSLDPPLVLISLSRRLRSFSTFAAAEAISITLLRQEQQNLSARFAEAGADKWGALEIEHSSHGVPCPAGGLARFDCVPHGRHDGGDHEIFVLRVTGFQAASEGSALVFYGGAYGAVAHAPAADSAQHILGRTA